MTARVAIVPSSTILAEPNLDLRASAYIVNEHRLKHCEAVARHRLQCGLTGLQKAAEERARVKAWQKEMGIQEITS